MILGTDRSHWNAKVPLSDLVAKGVKFIWFKATQADIYEDPTFNSSWQEAKNTAGLIRGAYHFFDPRIDGIVQAQHYLSTGINFANAGCLPPCVDIEDLTGNDAAQANRWVAANYKIAIQRLNDFLGYIKDHTGKECIIYTYNNYPKEYFHGYGFPANPMWLSSLQATCPNRYDTGTLPDFWQWTYNWNGTDMDGNYFTGTQDDLNKLANL